MPPLTVLASCNVRHSVNKMINGKLGLHLRPLHKTVVESPGQVLLLCSDGVIASTISTTPAAGSNIFPHQLGKENVLFLELHDQLWQMVLPSSAPTQQCNHVPDGVPSNLFIDGEQLDICQ